MASSHRRCGKRSAAPRWQNWSKLSPAVCMRAERDGQTTASGNAEVAATPSGADGGGLFGELVPANTKLIPPSLARNFGILEALLVAANEASNRSSDGSGSKGGSGPGTGGKDNRGGPGGYDAEPGDGAAGTLPPRRQDGNTRRRATEHGGPGGASPARKGAVDVGTPARALVASSPARRPRPVARAAARRPPTWSDIRLRLVASEPCAPRARLSAARAPSPRA